MTKTRDNHYVPQWYQKGFLSNPNNNLYYLDLTPDKILYPDGTPVLLADGTTKTHKSLNYWPTSKCFYQTDLYTTFFGQYINDDIERFLFGRIDDDGAKAVRAFIDTDTRGWHEHFTNFFSFIDTQKIRTPKGLDWIRNHYPNLNQLELMVEMQSIRNLHCAIWAEGVREIVSAENSDTKFIISDHPVTIYNYACPPESILSVYPNEPSVPFKASQTIFPLNKDLCLILTNLEYAKYPDSSNPTENRTHSKLQRNSLVRTDNYIRTRRLDDNQVNAINLVLKRRAKRYIAAEKREWLYPEQKIGLTWESAKNPQMNSPYLDARREWNERYGSYIQSARRWRTLAFISLAIAGVAVAGVVYLASQNKLVPYVVEVNHDGNALQVYHAEKMQPIDRRVVRAQLSQFVQDVRSVSSDFAVQRQSVHRAFAHLSPDMPAYTAVNDWFRKNVPFDRAKTETWSGNLF